MEDLDERKDAAKNILNEYERMVSDLLKVAKESRSVSDDDFYSAWLLAVDLLGDLRARDAVPYLVAEIASQAPSIEVGNESLLSGFPCARSLVKIGKPSVDAITKRATEPASKLEKLVIVLTLVSIVGEEGASQELEARLRYTDRAGERALRELIEIARDNEKLLKLLSQVNEAIRSEVSPPENGG